jgi:hypothetical protein
MYVKESKVEIRWHLPKPVNQTSPLDVHLKITDKPNLICQMKKGTSFVVYVIILIVTCDVKFSWFSY